MAECCHNAITDYCPLACKIPRFVMGIKTNILLVLFIEKYTTVVSDIQTIVLVSKVNNTGVT